jgi:hypothetical protein
VTVVPDCVKVPVGFGIALTAEQLVRLRSVQYSTGMMA